MSEVPLYTSRILLLQVPQAGRYSRLLPTGPKYDKRAEPFFPRPNQRCSAPLSSPRTLLPASHKATVSPVLQAILPGIPHEANNCDTPAESGFPRPNQSHSLRSAPQRPSCDALAEPCSRDASVTPREPHFLSPRERSTDTDVKGALIQVASLRPARPG